MNVQDQTIVKIKKHNKYIVYIIYIYIYNMITIDVKSITQYFIMMSGEEAKKHVIDMVIKEEHRKQKRKVAQRKYRKSEKGKLAAR